MAQTATEEQLLRLQLGKAREDLDVANQAHANCESEQDRLKTAHRKALDDLEKRRKAAVEDSEELQRQVDALKAQARTTDQELSQLRATDKDCARLQADQTAEKAQLTRKVAELNAAVALEKGKFEAEDESHKNTRRALDACKLELAQFKQAMDDVAKQQAAALADAERRAKDAESLQADADAEKARLSSRVVQLEKQIQAMQNGATQTTLDVEMKLAAAVADVARLTAELATAVAARDAAVTKFQTEEQRANALAQQLKKLGDDSVAAQQRLQAEIDRLSRENADLKTKLTAAETQNKQYQQQLALVQASEAGLQQQLAALQAQIVALNAQITAAEDAKSKAEKRTAQLEAEVQALQATLAAQAPDKAELAQKNALLVQQAQRIQAQQAQLDQRGAEIAKQAQKIQEQATEIAQLRGQLQPQPNPGQINNLLARVRQLEDQLEQLGLELERVRLDRDQALGELARQRAAGGQVAQLQDELDKLHGEIDRLKLSLETEKQKKKVPDLTDEECAKLLRDTIDTIEIWGPNIVTAEGEEPQLVMAGRGRERIKVISDASSYALTTVDRRVERFGSVSLDIIKHPLTVTTAKQLNQLQRSIIIELGGVFQKAHNDGVTDWKFYTEEDRDYCEKKLRQFGFQGVEHESGSRFSMSSTEYVFRPVPVAGAYYSPSGEPRGLDPGEARLEQGILDQLRTSDRSRALATILQSIAVYYRGTISVPSAQNRNVILVFDRPELAARASWLLAGVGIRHVEPKSTEKGLLISEKVGELSVPRLQIPVN